MTHTTYHKKNYILNSILGRKNRNATQSGSRPNLVPSVRLERTTSGLGNRCSIH
jgi:hypothetical protein